MPPPMLVNGQATNTIDARDRGLQYGDGVFETLALFNGVVRHWPAHLARLRQGCERLGLPQPCESTLLAEIDTVATRARREIVKLVVTRGVQGRGYRPLKAATPTRIVSRHDWPDHPASYSVDGIEATVCQTPLGMNPQLAGIKHLNRLEQVLARGEWADEYQEGVMYDTRGQVVSGTMSNLFIVSAAGLVTPDLSQCGIEGTMRAHVLELAIALGIRTEVRAVGAAELRTAQGLFFTNGVIGIWPVRRLDNRTYKIPELIRTLASRIGEPEPDQ